MKFKKAIMAGAATALFVGSVMNVSAAKAAPSNYMNVLKESNKENPIINVEAYKAAYSDLAAAFGDNTDAYIEHYLTKGVYEGRTKGVLFDPLAYAAAYSDVKNAYGNNIAAIVEHYLTFGIAENRTAGTANGYTDIAEAQKSGAPKIAVQREAARIDNAASNGAVYNLTADADNTANNNSAAVSVGNSNLNTAPAANIAGNTANSNITAATNTTPDSNTANTAPDNSPVPPADNSSASTGIIGYVPPQNNNNYHHTTSVYDDDQSTLIRVEYYDENNKLFEFSEVTNHDSSSNSYTEDVFYTDQESGEIVHDRTDTYVNGVLSSSEKH